MIDRCHRFIELIDITQLISIIELIEIILFINIVEEKIDLKIITFPLYLKWD
jgi:hypothetical protein